VKDRGRQAAGGRDKDATYEVVDLRDYTLPTAAGAILGAMEEGRLLAEGPSDLTSNPSSRMTGIGRRNK